MDQVIKSPVQIFINEKFFITAEEVQVRRNDAEFKQVDPNIGLGTVINIVKTKEEKKSETAERLKELREKDFDQWFHRMVNIKGDPNIHQPI